MTIYPIPVASRRFDGTPFLDVDGYDVPIDPQSGLDCESCQ